MDNNEKHMLLEGCHATGDVNRSVVILFGNSLFNIRLQFFRPLNQFFNERMEALLFGSSCFAFLNGGSLILLHFLGKFQLLLQ